MALLVITRPAS